VSEIALLWWSGWSFGVVGVAVLLAWAPMWVQDTPRTPPALRHPAKDIAVARPRSAAQRRRLDVRVHAARRRFHSPAATRWRRAANRAMRPRVARRRPASLRA